MTDAPEETPMTESPEGEPGTQAPEDESESETPEEGSGNENQGSDNNEAEQPVETMPEEGIENVIEPILDLDAEEFIQIINLNLENFSFSPEEIFATEANTDKE